MPYIPPEVVAKAKEMDLLTYLKNYEPGELVHFGGSTYCTRTHDSLKISNGKWCWFFRGIDSEVIDFGLFTGRLYESSGRYHNVVFGDHDYGRTPYTDI